MWSSSSVGSLLGMDSDSLEVRLLGHVDFDAALALQLRAVDELAGRTDRRGLLLLCEHPPLITLGREGSPDELAVDSAELVARQIPVRWVGRGGGAIAHGPGQLAIYLVVPIERLGLSPVALRTRLEEVLLKTCDDLRLPAFRRAEMPRGLWCRHGKLAEVGLAVRNGISWHGAFLNVEPSLDLMRLVAAPDGERITSLAAERHAFQLMHAVRSAVLGHVAGLFGYERQHVATGHPSLRRTFVKVPLNA